MVSFLEKTYKKFRLEMPFKINNNKIEYKKGIEYTCEIDKSQLKDSMVINKANKGYHLLNINYMYLLQSIFGDSIKLNNWFDISLFLEGKENDLGSVEKILKESKIDKKEEEYIGFVVID